MKVAVRNTGWICCQLGAREHYAIPRALHRRDALECLLTEAWIPFRGWLGVAPRRLRERFQAELATADVRAWTLDSMLFEIHARVRGASGWPLILERNHWFQRHAIAIMKRLEFSSRRQPPIIFAYSYAANEILRFAKSRGWPTVLGQIDPGKEMGLMLQRLDQQYPEFTRVTAAPPESYWDDWREECTLADAIVVNSHWSREALRSHNVDGQKIRVVPLAFEAPAEAAGFCREYPAKFSPQRPLRVLFLGQVTLLKGLIPMLQAAALLVNAPTEFHVVGPAKVSIPKRFHEYTNIHWHGLVPRSAVAEYFRSADVLLFPTFCDGFGLTQLEAQAWKLPIIASRFCGDVVEEDGRNGFLLHEVTGKAIADILRDLVFHPAKLASWSRESNVGPPFSLNSLADRLQALQTSTQQC